MNIKSIYHILLFALFTVFISACKSDGAFSSLNLSDSNGNGFSPEVELKPETPLPTLHVEPIKILPHESKSAALQVLTYEGDDIDMSDFSNITWSIDDESIATLNVSNSQATLTGVQRGTTPLYVSAEIDGAVISGQTTVTVYTNKVVAWGSGEHGADISAVRSQLFDIKKITSTNRGAFAALKSDGTVITWGQTEYGGDSRTVQAQLTDVVDIFSTNEAFAALKTDGTVVTWGMEYMGGDSSIVKDELTNVKTIYSNQGAFAALKYDGTVVSWGYNVRLGKLLVDIKEVYSNSGAFAAIKKNDGAVVAWGDGSIGGSIDYLAKPKLVGVKKIFAHKGIHSNAFAALKNDGSVVTWGDSIWGGGDSSSVQPELYDIQDIAASGFAFAAIRSDGAVITWGDIGGGTEVIDPPSPLMNVKKVFTTDRAFAALKDDGTVVTWGSIYDGGNSEDVQPMLNNVKNIYSTFEQWGINSTSFAALKDDGTVVSWGRHWSESESELTDIKEVYPTTGGYAALKNDNTAVTWGAIAYDEFPMPELKNVHAIYSNSFVFAAIVEEL